MKSATFRNIYFNNHMVLLFTHYSYLYWLIGWENEEFLQFGKFHLALEIPSFSSSGSPGLIGALVPGHLGMEGRPDTGHGDIQEIARQ